MRLTDDRVLLSASDLVAFLDCQHLSALDLRVARGLELIEETTTATGELVSDRSDSGMAPDERAPPAASRLAFARLLIEVRCGFSLRFIYH